MNTMLELISFIKNLPDDQTKIVVKQTNKWLASQELNLKDLVEIELKGCENLSDWHKKRIPWIVGNVETQQIINKILSLNPPENIKNELIAISIK